MKKLVWLRNFSNILQHFLLAFCLDKQLVLKFNKNLLISFEEAEAGLEATTEEDAATEPPFFSFDFLSFLLQGKKDILKNSLWWGAQHLRFWIKILWWSFWCQSSLQKKKTESFLSEFLWLCFYQWAYLLALWLACFGFACFIKSMTK